MTTHCAAVHRPAGLWPKDKAADVLTLDFDSRHRRRIRLTTDRGEDVLLNLRKAVAMAVGDGLQLDDQRWLRVEAAPETLIEVRHKDPHRLVCLAWHLGNWHLPTEFRDQALRIRPDDTIEDMLHELGADLATIRAPFQPAGGAYNGYRHRQTHDDHHR